MGYSRIIPFIKIPYNNIKREMTKRWRVVNRVVDRRIVYQISTTHQPLENQFINNTPSPFSHNLNQTSAEWFPQGSVRSTNFARRERAVGLIWSRTIEE